jgi:AcrR family transcriptional regulator
MAQNPDAELQPATPSADPAPAPRKRGRPPRTIDNDAVVRAIERLFAEGGIDAVTIERTAQEISVSRATLYRTVPSKEHLLGILFERMTQDLDRAARLVTQDEGQSTRESLEGLVRVQIHAAVQMRDYLFVYFDGTWLPEGVYDNWRHWTHEYERVWLDTVTAAMADGDLPDGEPVIMTRLILGMTIWVANWFRPEEGFTADQVADHAIRLLDAAAAGSVKPPAPRPAANKKKSPRARKPAAKQA